MPVNLHKLLVHIAQDCTLDSLTINVLDALFMMRTAWNSVTMETIANCFDTLASVLNTQSQQRKRRKQVT